MKDSDSGLLSSDADTPSRLSTGRGMCERQIYEFRHSQGRTERNVGKQDKGRLSILIKYDIG